MYNQEIKERFLTEYTSGGKSKDSAGAMLDSVGVYEELLNKDVAEMSREDVIEALRYANIGTYKTAAAAQSVLRNYVKWCRANAVFSHVNEGLLSIEVDDIDSSRYLGKLLFRSEDDLISELKTVRVFEDGYPEIIVLLLGWIGVEQKDVLSIKISDVSTSDKTVYLRVYNRTIHYSDKIADILSMFERTKEGSRSAGGDSRIVYRDDSYDRFVRKYCAKGQLGKEFTPTQVKHMVSKLNLAYVAQGNEPRFTGGNVVMSGALHRVWQLENSGVDVFSIKNKAVVAETFIVNAKLHEILWLYKNYKRAFSL